MSENGSDSSKRDQEDTDLLKDVLKKQSKSKKDDRSGSPGLQSAELAIQKPMKSLKNRVNYGSQLPIPNFC